MVGKIWKITLGVGLSFLVVINSLGAASVLLLQKHQNDFQELINSTDADKRKEAIETAKRRLNLASLLAPWSPQPGEAKLSFTIYLAKLGIDLDPNLEEVIDTFIQTAKRAPTREKAYTEIVNLYLLKPQLFNNWPNYSWTTMLKVAEGFNPTLAYIQQLWGILLHKALSETEHPSQELIGSLCLHYGKYINLEGNRISLDMVNNIYGICFGLTRDIELLAPLMPIKPELWRLWGEYLCSGNRTTWIEVRPFIERRIFQGEQAPFACTELAEGLRISCTQEALGLVQTCIMRYPEYTPGWNWLIYNIEKNGAVIDKSTLSDLIQFALRRATLNENQIAALSLVLCKRKMYDLAAQVIETGTVNILGRKEKILEALARCLIDKGQNKAAIEMLEKSLTKYPHMVWAWIALGRLQMDDGQILKGEQSMNRALKLDPGNSQAIQYLKKQGIY